MMSRCDMYSSMNETLFSSPRRIGRACSTRFGRRFGAQRARSESCETLRFSLNQARAICFTPWPGSPASRLPTCIDRELRPSWRMADSPPWREGAWLVVSETRVPAFR